MNPLVYHFAIILNSTNIIYCSSQALLAKFEIIEFTNLLIEQLDPESNWTLHKIILKPTDEENMLKILVRQQMDKTSNTKIQFCIISEMGIGSVYGYQLLDLFMEQFCKEYPLDTIASDLDDDKIEEIQSLGNLLFATVFGSTYKDMIKSFTESEVFSQNNKVLYMGLSTRDGVPIISKIFTEGNEILAATDEKRISYLNTVLSGQLATVLMNAFLRSAAEITSIQVQLNHKDFSHLFFDFGSLGSDNSYVFEIIAVGSPEYVIDLKNKIIEELNGNEALQAPFAGQIKNYIPLIQIFEKYYSM